ncbi:uncharacterized protein K452DRAFT_1791 [Aplosporella prunicola CBS 121167]|uniref:Uncharacterized protein n=1 Tax=Aplosporella prunicola CBS 121167 TaxID=1176127 RepID=A0A6A6BTI3_9PEZI|nr:uncharacterized protein K452DRAFT_1791 [Aplosporella prunicola CBS 121167]KAF2147108.1 hypothetical protein K452DRAFT_1791 [Aplosporella prunicola CBS 121167]
MTSYLRKSAHKFSELIYIFNIFASILMYSLRVEAFICFPYNIENQVEIAPKHKWSFVLIFCLKRSVLSCMSLTKSVQR